MKERREEILTGLELAVSEILSPKQMNAWISVKERSITKILTEAGVNVNYSSAVMEELKKISRIINTEYPEAYLETLIVLDGTTGQNALVQAKQFSEVADISGIVLTKLDGTAKGGIAIAIQSEMDIPVKYIGIGEKIDDLQKFNPTEFVNALFEVPRQGSE